jgi:Fe-Mn family superoxide dismutase
MRQVTEAHKSREKLVFNNAAQSWNHSFQWRCMKPGGGGVPNPNLEVAQEMLREFGTPDAFNKTFKETALSVFASGYCWMVVTKEGRLKIYGVRSERRVASRAPLSDCCPRMQTKDADNPLTHGDYPLMTLDLWEHGYALVRAARHTAGSYAWP